MPTYPLNGLTDMAALSAEEVERLRALGTPPVRFKRDTVIRSEGEDVDCIYLMIEGWVTASINLPTGGRQIMTVHLPGDMFGTPSMALDVSAETLCALTDCRVAAIPLARLRELFTANPRLAGLFLMAVQIERIGLMDTVAAMGRTTAREQVVSFYLDLHDRLSQIGLVEDGTFTVPMSQEQISDKLGITPVHVNRTLKMLDAEKLITRARRRIRLNDISALRTLSQLPRRRLRTAPEWLPQGRA